MENGTNPPPFIRSALWAALAALSFAIMITAVHYMEGKFDAYEVVFFRALVGLFIVVPIVTRSGFKAFKTAKMPLHFVRTLFALFAMTSMYYAVAVLPVAQVIALTFLIPLFTTVAAGLVLRENVGIHRWLATLVGFVGAMVIIRPGIIEISASVLLAVLSSAFYAGAWSSVKILTRTESAASTVFWMNVLIIPMAAIPMVFFWVTPDWADVPPILTMAVSGWTAHFCQARAFEGSDASAVMPFDFLRLPLGAVFGYFIFAELIDVWTWVGAVIIFTAGYYIIRREALKKSS